MTGELLEDLTRIIAPLLGLVIVHGVLLPRLRRNEPPAQILMGLLFGSSAVVGMAFPFVLQSGTIFDGRTVVLSLAGFFGGPVVAAVAAVVAAGYRIGLGGAGMWMGLATIATATGFGVAGRQLLRSRGLQPRSTTFLALGLAVHLCALMWMLLLPQELRALLLRDVAAWYVAVLAVSTWVFGHAFQINVSRHDALRAAGEAEGRFRSLVEASQVGVYLVQQGRLIYANSALERIFGYGTGALSGRLVEELVAPEERERLRAQVRAELGSGAGVANLTFRARHADGHDFQAEMYGSLTRRDGRSAIVGMLVDVTERELATQRLAQSERLLREAQHAGRIGSFILDVIQGTWSTSDVIEEVFGLTADMPRTIASWYALIAPEQRAAMMAEGARILKGEKRFSHEYQIVRGTDGERRWVMASGEVERDAAGKALRLVGVIKDIDERKRTALQLAESERRFRSLVEAIPDLIWLKDPQGVYLSCNRQFERFFGHAEAEIIGKTDFDFVDAELAEFFRQNDRDAMAAGRPTVNEETITYASDGRTVPVETIKTPLFDAQGRIVSVLGIARDISHRKQAELALRRSEALHREAQRVAQIGHWELDHGSGQLVLSEQTYLVFERAPETWNATYTNFLDALHPQDRARVDRTFAESLAARTVFKQIYRLLLPDGRIKYIESRGETSFDADGRPLRTVGTVQDVTERSQAQEELASELANTRMMLDTMTDGYIRADLHGRILDANPAYCRMLGLTRDEIVGRSIADFKVAGTAGEVPVRIDRILATGQQRFSTRHRRKDGSVVDIEASAVSMPHAQPPQLSAFFRDVTQERRVEAHYQELVNRIPAGVFRYRRSRGDGHFEYISPRLCDLLDVNIAQVTADPAAVFQRLRSEDLAQFAAQRAKARSGAEPFYWEGRLNHVDPPRWVRVEAGATVEDDGDLVWHGIVTDVTVRQQLLERLRLDSAVINSTFESIMITDLDGIIISVNPAFTEITGYSPDEAIGRNANLLKSGRQDVSFYQGMFRALKQAGHWQGQIWNRRKSGELYPELLNISVVRDVHGTPTHYAGVATDISQIKRSEEQLVHMAHHDALTGMPNRLQLGLRLEHALEQAQREQSELAVLYVDLDRFKNVNDSLGHLVGDQLLLAVAERLRGALREQDTLGRLGGDEFLIMLERIGSSMSAAKVAQGLLSALAQPFRIAGGHELYIQASIGICLYPADGDRAELMIRNADTAMFRAKEHGRNNYQFYTEALTLAASGRLELETRMRQALRDDEFQVWYQPIYRFADRRIVGAEALIRWRAADGTMVPPDVFIPVAEDSGLIVAIGRQVLRKSCSDLRTWLDDDLKIELLAVNLSVQQFREADFELAVAREIGTARVPPGIIELEITERGLMDLGAETLRTLDALKAQGVRLAIDDFGTGYSSLTYLKRMPVDKLKIDRSFVRELPHDSSDAAIVHTIIAIARTLGLKVLAEGVETAEQLAFLRAAGCNECQGFLFGPAVPAEQFATQLREQKLPIDP